MFGGFIFERCTARAGGLGEKWRRVERNWAVR